MTQHCFQTPNSKKHNKSCEFPIFSTIFSHPLYFSYLIFFFPYLLKLLSFLSPLFMTTSLLFLSLLTAIIPLHSIISSKEGFLLTVYSILLEKLRPAFDKEGEELLPLEEFEVYKIVFETPTIGIIEENPDENERLEENPGEFSEEKGFQEERETGVMCESLTTKLETGVTNPNKVKEQVKKFESVFNRSGSEASKIIVPNSEYLKPKYGSLRVDDEKKLSEAFSQTVGRQPSYLGSFGSMRKEREWRRTLACKLFEERHNGNFTNVNGGGGSEERMDLLWESHETESNRGLGKTREENKKGRRRREKVEEEEFMVVSDDEKDEDCDDENGKLCCLAALKLSAGKMNLNMGRPNLIKIGKAFKGIGWLQSHVTRQGKKGYK